MDSNKHAYLILAHNEFDVLQKLVELLDDERNDIYLHIDKKVHQIPTIRVSHSRLFRISSPVNVYWGHTSQLKAEFLLMETALRQYAYSRFHIISGVHLPLQKQDVMHLFFDENIEKNYLMLEKSSADEVDLKMRRYNFFVKHPCEWTARSEVFLWHMLIKLQRIFGVKRYANESFTKASQWVSINREAVMYLIKNKSDILKRYRWTYCPDEFFIPSELSRSPFANTIVNFQRLLMCEFEGVSPKIYTTADFDMLISSKFFFARKFNKQNIQVVDRILSVLK